MAAQHPIACLTRCGVCNVVSTRRVGLASHSICEGCLERLLMHRGNYDSQPGG
jgi:hypothetical protein